MNDQISLRAYEKKAYQLAFEDGLWEIYMGFFPAQFALAPLLSETMGDFWSSVIFLPFYALVWIGIRWIKTNVIHPRLGTVRLSSKRLERSRLARKIIISTLTATIVIGIALSMIALANPFSPVLIFSLIIFIAFSILAYFIEVPRMSLFGAMLGLAPIMGEWLWRAYHVPHHGFPLTFGVTALIISGSGLYRFLRFLYTYPAVEDSESEFRESS